ncbi:hypothetical protein ADUPG1_000882, partial [Aduncisulcus paluster]
KKLLDPRTSIDPTLSLSILKSIVNISKSIFFHDIPHEYLENLDMFFKYLIFIINEIPLPDVESSPKHRPHLVDELKEEVVNVFTLCIQKYFEDISGEPNPDSAYAPVAKDTIQNMTSAVWTNLSKMGLIRRFNNCAHASLRFLSCVVNSPSYSLFESKELLRKIIDDAILPSLMHGESDEDLFTSDPRLYCNIQLDSSTISMTGSCINERRKAAKVLMRALLQRFEDQITGYVNAKLRDILPKLRVDHQGDKEPVCALISLLSLFSSVSAKSLHPFCGVSMIFSNCEVQGMYTNVVRPFLESVAQGKSISIHSHFPLVPIAVCECFKFCSDYRAFIDVDPSGKRECPLFDLSLFACMILRQIKEDELETMEAVFSYCAYFMGKTFRLTKEVGECVRAGKSLSELPDEFLPSRSSNYVIPSLGIKTLIMKHQLLRVFSAFVSVDRQNEYI